MKKLSTLLLLCVFACSYAAAGVDVTTPGDAVIGMPADSTWPTAEAPAMAIDDDITTKYLNYSGAGTGIIITTQAGTDSFIPTVVNGLGLTTANDFEGRDPLTYELYGTNGYISEDNWQFIASGDITDFANLDWDRQTPNSTPITFDNEKAYKHYYLVFPTNGGEDIIQVAEIELLGSDSTTSYITNPDPAVAEMDVDASNTLVLQWDRVEDANNINATMSYNVYFGDEPNSLEADYYGLNLVKTTSTDASDLFCYISEDLADNTTYYWRVDALEPNGVNTTVHTGSVWHFTTTRYVPEMLTISDDQDARNGTEVTLTATYDDGQATVDGATWYLNDVAIDPDTDSNYTVTTADGASVLTIAAASEDTVGTYHCIVSNSYGSSERSPYSIVSLRTEWVWTGDAGTTSWTTAENWDEGVSPELSSDMLIGEDGEVVYDGDDNYYYSGYLTLEDNAKLTVPDGLRFGGGNGETTVTTISDDSQLIVEETDYVILAFSNSSTVNQTGGTFQAAIDRGFYFTDASGISGTYNLTGGTMQIDYVNASSYYENWYKMMGYSETSENNTLNINGGNAYFNNGEGYSGRCLYIMRNSEVTISNGSANFSELYKLSIGQTEAGTATVQVNENGSLNTDATPIYVGDEAAGRLEVNGGTVNLTSDDTTDRGGLYVGYSQSGDGTVEQVSGTVDLNALEINLGSAEYTDTTGEYVISGGSLAEVGALNLYANSNFEVSGSGATAIDVQELIVEDESATMTFDLDANGCSVVTVGNISSADPNYTDYTNGAQLAGLTLQVNVLDTYEGTESDVFDLIWVATGDLAGTDSITLLNNTDYNFELQVVDAADYGYAGGQLIQLARYIDASKADFNFDNRVDLEDLAIFSRFWLWEDED